MIHKNFLLYHDPVANYYVQFKHSRLCETKWFASVGWWIGFRHWSDAPGNRKRKQTTPKYRNTWTERGPNTYGHGEHFSIAQVKFEVKLFTFSTSMSVYLQNIDYRVPSECSLWRSGLGCSSLIYQLTSLTQETLLIAFSALERLHYIPLRRIATHGSTRPASMAFLISSPSQ